MTDLSQAHDGVWLAATVRVLAGDVRRLCADPEQASPVAIAEARATLGELRAHLAQHPASSTPLHRWTENLARQLASIV